MLTLDLGNGWTSMKLVPYMADELFYNLADKEINWNHFYLGIKVKKYRYINLLYILCSSVV